MKYASSIRYGGLLIAAPDCDYESFRNLGLTCMCCHESVFLVAGYHKPQHQREYNGKVITVAAFDAQPYFSHRPDKDKKELAGCELRSQQITDKELQRNAIASKSQRIKLFNAHLWKILKLCYKLNDFKQSEALVKNGFKLVSATPVYSRLVSLLLLVYRQECSRIHSEASMFIEDLISKTQRSECTGSRALSDLLSIWRSSIDKKMHIQIYNEVVDCLAIARHQPILEKLVVLGIYNFIACEAVRREQNLSFKDNLASFNRLHNHTCNFKVETIAEVITEIVYMNTAQFEGLASFVRDDILEVVGLTPWADGFETLTKLPPNSKGIKRQQ